MKDRLYTRPLPYTKTRFSTSAVRIILDEDVLAERERVALFEDGEKEEEDVVEIGSVARSQGSLKSNSCKRRVAGRIERPELLRSRIKMDAAPEDKYGLNVRGGAQGLPAEKARPKPRAVRGCTFGVRTGEVFGLLSVWKSKSYVAFMPHATPDSSSPRHDLVKTCRAHPTHS